MTKLKNRLLKLSAGLMLSLCASVALAVGVEVTFYHNDLLGSPVAATDEAGELKWRKSYKPYGEELETAPDSDEEFVGYTGHRLDKETGLVYAGARHYDPVIGRFMGMDPAGVLLYVESNPMMFNRFAYANNSPYRYIDPDGESPLDVANPIPNSKRISDLIGPKPYGLKRADPGKAYLATRGMKLFTFRVGSHQLKLDRKGLHHILHRHHPRYWDGSIKARQTFFRENTPISILLDIMKNVIRQNRDVIKKNLEKGRDTFQIRGKVNTEEYVVGFNKGRVGQFYPTKNQCRSCGDGNGLKAFSR